MIVQDVRHSLRSLRRSPALAVIAILTVALGVGAGTALFSVVKAVLLNPMPYPDSNRLVWVAAILDGNESRTSMPDFDDYKAGTGAFDAIAAYSEAPLVAGGGDAPERITGTMVTEDFFDLLGVPPALGRTFNADEHRQKPLSTVVISHGLWQRMYGGDPNILGRSISVLGFPSTVIGVMPAGFAFPSGAELWVSARAINEGNLRTAHNYWVIGRLRPGVSTDAAHQDVGAIARRLKQEHPSPFQTSDARVVSLASHLVGGVRTPLLMLFGAVGLVLLIVCVNVANLMLVRVTAQSGELALRTALGAGRRDLIRHLLVESVILSAFGGVLGLLIAFWSMDLLRLLLPASLPRAAEVRIDPGVVAFAMALSTMAGVLFGTLPAWRAGRTGVHDLLKAGARGQTATRRSRGVQSALVICEVALSLVLVAAAGLLLDSVGRLRAVDVGFSTAGVLTMDVSFPVSRGEVLRLKARYDDLLARVLALPGVEAAGTIKDLPLTPIQRSGHFFIERRPKDAQVTEAGHLVVTAGVMEALRIPILQGRGLSDADAEGAPPVIVISEGMARKFWPDADPIGQRIWFDSFEPKEQWRTIVGVAGNVRQSGLTEPARPQAYVSYAQTQIKAQLGSANLIVRSSVDPRSLAPAVRAALQQASPEAAASFRTLDEVMAVATSRQRFQMQVMMSFAMLALVLAAVGLYGVLSYTVTSARGAIGIRMALGAAPGQIFRMVAARALGLAAAGALAGLVGCLALRGVLRTVVFGVGPSDPRILSLAVVVMLATALAACWFPARRAMSVDPIAALREE
jgi:predicted permease